jgi:hypothetical protein
MRQKPLGSYTSFRPRVWKRRENQIFHNLSSRTTRKDVSGVDQQHEPRPLLTADLAISSLVSRLVFTVKHNTPKYSE